MAKMTKEEKKAQQEAKKAAAKAKREAKKAARLEKLEKRREKKRLAREAKKAKALAKREKAKAKKAKERERAKLLKAKEKARAQKTAKKDKNRTSVKDAGAIDIREASKMMKKALAWVADDIAKYDADKRLKKAKAMRGLGYDVEIGDGNIIVRFIAAKNKKVKGLVAAKAVANVDSAKEPDADLPDNISNEDDNEKQPTEVPAGDLYGQNGNPESEIANIENDDEIDDNDEHDEDFMPDSRDEQDEDLIDNRREFFGNYGDDGEMNEE